MGTAFVAMSMSVDGIIGGSDVDTERLLHEWFFTPSERNEEIIDELRDTIGAVVMGRRTYDEGAEADGFVDNPYPVDHFVLSHDVPETSAKGETSFTFVSDGVESALAQADEAAGDDDVCVMGWRRYGSTVPEGRRLIDEIQIHLVPVLLGSSVRLFGDSRDEPIELERTRLVESCGVVQLRFRVARCLRVTEGSHESHSLLAAYLVGCLDEDDVRSEGIFGNGLGSPRFGRRLIIE